MKTKRALYVAAVAGLLLLSASAYGGCCTPQRDVVCGAYCVHWTGDLYTCWYAWLEPAFCIEVYPGCLDGRYHCSCEDPFLL